MNEMRRQVKVVMGMEDILCWNMSLFIIYTDLAICRYVYRYAPNDSNSFV